jgi:uncharacterized protein YjbI with pentapeptide repeats
MCISFFAGKEEKEQLLSTNLCMNCDLSNAWLEETGLWKEDLTGANFTGTDLSNVKLRGANLSNAILDNTILR